MAFTNTINNILTGLQYAPFITVAMQQVEASNAGLPGETKKAIILAGIQAAAKVGEQVSESHVQVISALVDLLAGVLFPHNLTAPVK